MQQSVEQPILWRLSLIHGRFKDFGAPIWQIILAAGCMQGFFLTFLHDLKGRHWGLQYCGIGQFSNRGIAVFFEPAGCGFF